MNEDSSVPAEPVIVYYPVYLDEFTERLNKELIKKQVDPPIVKCSVVLPKHPINDQKTFTVHFGKEYLANVAMTAFKRASQNHKGEVDIEKLSREFMGTSHLSLDNQKFEKVIQNFIAVFQKRLAFKYRISKLIAKKKADLRNKGSLRKIYFTKAKDDYAIVDYEIRREARSAMRGRLNARVVLHRLSNAIYNEFVLNSRLSCNQLPFSHGTDTPFGSQMDVPSTPPVDQIDASDDQIVPSFKGPIVTPPNVRIDASSGSQVNVPLEGLTDASSKGLINASLGGPSDVPVEGPADESSPSECQTDTSSEGQTDTSSEGQTDTSSEDQIDTTSEDHIDTSLEGPTDTHSEIQTDTSSRARIDIASEHQADAGMNISNNDVCSICPRQSCSNQRFCACQFNKERDNEDNPIPDVTQTSTSVEPPILHNPLPHENHVSSQHSTVLRPEQNEESDAGEFADTLALHNETEETHEPLNNSMEDNSSSLNDPNDLAETKPIELKESEKSNDMDTTELLNNHCDVEDTTVSANRCNGIEDTTEPSNEHNDMEEDMESESDHNGVGDTAESLNNRNHMEHTTDPDNMDEDTESMTEVDTNDNTSSSSGNNFIDFPNANGHEPYNGDSAEDHSSNTVTEIDETTLDLDEATTSYELSENNSVIKQTISNRNDALVPIAMQL